MSPEEDGELLNESGGNNIALAWKSLPVAEDVTIDMADEGNQCVVQGGYIAAFDIEFLASTESTTSQITTPVCEPGDILILVDHARNSGVPAPTSVKPADFDYIAQITASLSQQDVSIKIAEVGDSERLLTGMDGSTSDNKLVLAFRPSVPVSFLAEGLVQTTIGSAPDAVTTLAGDNGAAPLLVLGFYYGSNAVTGLSMTPAEDGEVVGARAAVKWKKYLTSPANVTIDKADDGFSNTLQALYLEFEVQP
jgi:hypothetical protein